MKTILTKRSVPIEIQEILFLIKSRSVFEIIFKEKKFFIFLTKIFITT